LYMNLSARKRFILTATCSYLIFGSAWIFLSDRLLLAFTDASSLTEMSTVKGIAFISLTALLLLVALSIIPDRSEREAQGRLRSAELIGSGDHLPRWVPYAFAVLVTVSVLAMRMKIAVSFGERPLLVLFMLPIIFSSVLGGFGPGVLATVIAALGVDYFGIPPLRSLHIREPFDLFQWAILVGTGVLASYLNELLHRARRQAEERRMQVELAQEALRQSEERFQLAMRGANDGLWDWNLHTDELYLSPRWKLMLGYRQDELAPHFETWKLLVHPNDRQRTLALVGDLKAGRRDRLEVEFRMRHRQGRYLDILSRAYPVTDETGHVVRLVGTHVDISDRKAAEAEIHALNAELEQRVAQRTAELVAANAELESFSSAVSHDLRAPLRAMSGFSQALLEDYGDRLEEGARAHLEQIIVGSRRMGELIDGLLTLSRTTRSRLQRVRVDLSIMAERLLGELSATDPDRQVEWQVEPGLNVLGDATMLEVVMNNLLANSWKYTSQREKAVIRVFVREEAGQRFFCVADNGAGFEAALAARLFEPFQRLHRQEEFPGIGIGLATAQRIIHRHGGVMLAEGRRNEGATFCFSLPELSEKKKEGA
jgi:PAS domain S-box-containing protein